MDLGGKKRISCKGFPEKRFATWKEPLPWAAREGGLLWHVLRQNDAQAYLIGFSCAMLEYSKHVVKIARQKPCFDNRVL